MADTENAKPAIPGAAIQASSTVEGARAASVNPPRAEETSVPVYSVFDRPNPPDVYYITGADETNLLLSRLRGNVVGFDMEWRVLFKKSNPVRPVVLIQICDATTIILIQVSKMNSLPVRLKELLENPRVIKAGVCIANDITKLQKEYDIDPKGTFELSGKCCVPEHGCKKLSDLVANHLGCTLLKDSVRTSNWEKDLDEEQITYASNDVYATYEVYQHLHGGRTSASRPEDADELSDSPPAKRTRTSKKTSPSPSTSTRQRSPSPPSPSSSRKKCDRPIHPKSASRSDAHAQGRASTFLSR